MLTRRFVRFAATGVVNTALHAAVATLWIHWVSNQPSLANAVAFAVATIFSFFANTLWSFSASVDRTVLLRFVVVALVGLPIAAGVSGAIDALGFSYKVGIVAVVCVMPPVNFLMHHYWTYRVPASSTFPTINSKESQTHE